MKRFVNSASLEEKVGLEARYVIETKKTIREAAKDLGMSKSVLHRHLSEVLEKVDREAYLAIKKIFLEHNKMKHINGGLATKNKYKLENNC